ELFIQAHALARLEERMDGMDIGILHFSLFCSCKSPEIRRNHHGEWLFAFRLMDVKTGYFIADIIGHKIIFRTFLFLTHNGTPEGEKLNKLIGLKKEDKEWLNIDKLSTFLNSDITRDARLRQLFIEAGCEPLFAVAQELSISEQMKPEKQMADFIVRYLRLGDK
ncbi:MAG TPA: hypothetical protein VLD19_08605, partial [Chitinophagaceae bacterium]|nr:hypothetical protein [Chitinophagaceae bacterium]